MDTKQTLEALIAHHHAKITSHAAQQGEALLDYYARFSGAEPGEPVEPEPDPDPPPSDLTAPNYYDPGETPVPADSVEAAYRIGLPSPFWPGLGEWELPASWSGAKYHGCKKKMDWGDTGTLWLANAYNVHGEVDGLEMWEIGDFSDKWPFGNDGKDREGHGLYLRCLPYKDTTLRNLKARRMGAQAIQREARATETDFDVIDPDLWWDGDPGTFLVEGGDFRECGLIDGDHGGSAPRASWVLALYATRQRTIVTGTTVVNLHAPAPHEGAVYVGFGQTKHRTPYAEVSGCRFLTYHGDRAEIFYQGVDEGVVKTTEILGAGNYVDVVQDCGSFVLTGMPQDTVVHEKAPPPDQHRPPVKTHSVKAGSTLELHFT